MNMVETLFQELDKGEEYTQNAIEFIDSLQGDAELKLKAEQLYREIEKRFKVLLAKTYPDAGDRQNFGDVIQNTVQAKWDAETPDMELIYLTCLKIAGYKLRNPEQTGIETT